jgi:hypothetical protein
MVGPDSVVHPIEEPRFERSVQDGVDQRVGLACEEGCHRGEAHHRRALGDKRTQRVGQHRRADEVHGEDAPPVGHGGRDPGCVGDGSERTEVGDPRGESSEALSIRDVEDEGFDGNVSRGCDLLGSCADSCLVQVDEHHRVHQLREAVGTGEAHPSPRSGRDADSHRCTVTT